MKDIDQDTINLAAFFVKGFEKDQETFIKTMIKFPSIASAGKFVYDFALGKQIIPNIESCPVEQKNRYWALIRETKLTMVAKTNFCKALYAIETLMPLITQP